MRDLADKYVMATDVETILKLEVPLIVQIGERQMSMNDLLLLGPGVIVELEKSVENDLELLINNKPAGTGTPVKIGENFGIKITSVNSPEQRIEALG